MAEIATKRIFISHTKQEAPVAILLKRWIDQLFPGSVEAFVSESDISAGAQWLHAVEDALRAASLVMVLCSPPSVRKTWVVFEAGGAWGRNVPLLPICHSGLAVSDLPSPLSAFQALSISAPNFATRLSRSIADSLSVSPSGTINDKALFDQAATTVQEARQTANRFDVFVSAPMSSLESTRYGGFRKSLQSVLDALEAQQGLSSYYFAGKTYGNVKQFDEHLVGTKRDMRALANSDRFMFVLPERLVSSTLVEAGFALALGIPSVLFVRQREDLPYALQEIGQLSENMTIIKVSSIKDIATSIARHGAELWPNAWGRAYV